MEVTAIVGVDIGKRVDPTAIVITEPGQRQTERTRQTFVEDPLGIADKWIEEPEQETVFTVRDIQQLPLDTNYMPVGKHLATLVSHLVDRAEDQFVQQDIKAGISVKDRRKDAEASVWILVDATGVGTAVVDIVRSELQGLNCPLTEVTFCHGQAMDFGPHSRAGRLGKARMVSHLEALIETDRIRMPDLEEADQLFTELHNFDIKTDEATAKDSYGAKIGHHDDIIVALALATILDPAGYRMELLPNPF